MTIRRSRTATARTLAVTALAALTLAGCGAGGDGSGGGDTGGGAPSTDQPVAPASRDDALASKVPQAVKADGKMVFGTDASYPPNEFTAPDGTTVVGMEVDLATAIAQKLGLTAKFQNGQFSGIIPGIQGSKYEAAISSLTINDERVKTVDMVSYFSAGTSLTTKKGNPDGINPDNLCGKAVGVQSGTVQVEDVVARSKKCQQSGQPPIAITEQPQQTDVTLALSSNRIVAMLSDSPVAAYAVTTTRGAVEVIGQPYDTAPYGVALKKGQAGYAQAVQGAVQALIADGTYRKVLDKWQVGNGAIPTSEIKGG